MPQPALRAIHREALRAWDVARARARFGRLRDPATGAVYGPLTAREAQASGWLEMGRHSYGTFTVHAGLGDRTRVRMGAFCSVALGAEFFLGGNHRPDWVTTFPLRIALGLPGAYDDGHPRPERDIVVGNDVWIGAGAKVLPGVTIGDGAVVGGGAVVSRNVRPYAIVVGNPAREVRRRFADEHVEALLRIRWWDWPDDVVTARVDELCAADLDAFVRAHDPRALAS